MARRSETSRARGRGQADGGGLACAGRGESRRDLTLPDRPRQPASVRRRLGRRAVARPGGGMNRDLLIGIDAGTSVIKAVAFTISGEQVAIASRPNAYA